MANNMQSVWGSSFEVTRAAFRLLEIEFTIPVGETCDAALCSLLGANEIKIIRHPRGERDPNLREYCFDNELEQE